MIIDKLIESRIKTYAFVGPSGTGKSYRAQMVAAERNIKYIIDDGLLINDTKVIAGTSAKKAPTKIETVKRALFSNEKDVQEMKKAFLKYRPDSILILGTSDSMIEKIRKNLGLPELTETIYINDVATDDEIEDAKRMRTVEGKHVIPVPTFEIKKDFSGYILDPLQIFKSKGKNHNPYIAEKSIIRPTFSYMGNYQISETVFKQIIELQSQKADFINKISRIRINTTPTGVGIYMEIVVNYGYQLKDCSDDFKKKCVKEIEQLTAMNIDSIEITIKGLEVKDNK